MSLADISLVWVTTLVAVAVHLGTLLLDPWLKPSLSQVLVPFTMSYRTVWTGLGVLAAYGFLTFGLTGYLRRRIGRRWNMLHRFTGLAWVLAVAHTLGSGSDAGQPWYLAVVALCVLPVVGLTARRVLQARRRPTRRAATPPRHARPPQPRADAQTRAAALRRRVDDGPRQAA